MACSDVPKHGVPLEIICIASREENGQQIHELELNEDKLKTILLHPEVKNRPIVVVSIAGAFRNGKSFLLGFFLKYLETQPLERDWLNKEDKIEGFEWRSGTRRVTTGIQIWSEPFILEKTNGEKVAVLLVDTQGVFDNDSTMADCTAIFALSNLISSVQMYNLMRQIQENDLHHFEFFIEFCKLVSEEADKNETDVRNPRLVFLIRDWEFFDEHPFGHAGGESYIQQILKVKEEGLNELQNIRKKIEKWFPNNSGFLLPHPGKKVARKTYDGIVKEMDDDFVESVQLLVPYILSKDRLVTKRINSVDVTGENMLKYIKAFVNVFKNGGLPTPQTLFQATAEVGYQLAIAEGFEIYVKKMTEVCKSADGKYMSDAGLEELNGKKKEVARDHLKAYPRMLRSENQIQCLQKLDDLMDIKYNDFKEIIKTQNKDFMIKRAVQIAGVGVGAIGVVALSVMKHS